MFSPVLATDCWEILLTTPDGVQELFGSGDLCGSCKEAADIAGAVADWFALGAWHDRTLDRLTPEDRTDLFALRDGYRAAGVDTAAVRVRVRAVRRSMTAFGVLRLVHAPDDADTVLDAADIPVYSATPDGPRF